MRSVVLKKNNDQAELVLQDQDIPVPGDNEVLVRIHASSINRRDFWITQGLYPGMTFDCIPGSDAAGVIESTGHGVKNSLTGQEVVIYPVLDWGANIALPGADYRILGMPDNGTFADYICVPAENVLRKPAHMSMLEAAAMPLAGVTAWRALVTKAQLQRGETLMITGIGGGVACMALLLAVNMGGKVLVTSSSETKILAAQKLGALAGFNYSDSDWHDRLRQDYGGLDVVVDGNCGPQFNACFKSMNPGGRYIIYGFTQGQPASGFDPARLFFKQLRIEGTTMASAAEFRDMLAFVSEQTLRPVVDRVFPLQDVVAATRYVGEGRQMGKVVLDHLA